MCVGVEGVGAKEEVAMIALGAIPRWILPESRVLNVIFRHGPITCLDIGAFLWMTSNAVLNHLARLETEGYVRAVERVEGRKGRLAKLWDICGRPATWSGRDERQPASRGEG
jgi:hypothetical protein